MVVGLVAVDGPAWADPAAPTHYRSTVTDVRVDELDGRTSALEPEVDPTTIDVAVMGGDAFMVVRAAGRRVEIPGYDGEPYVRFHADGRVEVNERSPAHWLNDARYGGLEVVPPSADADAPPSWVAVADGGTYAWHDHRVHFMAPSLPRHVDPSVRQVQHVFDWQVPLVVDGVPVVVEGRLEWLPSPGRASQAWVVLAVVVAAAAGLWAARRWGPSATTGVALSLATAIGLVVGSGGWWGLPAGAEGPLPGLNRM